MTALPFSPGPDPALAVSCPTHDNWVVLPVWAVLFGSLHGLVTGQVTLAAIGSYNLQLPELVLLTFVPALISIARRFPMRIGWSGLMAVAFIALWVGSMVRGLAVDPGAALTSARANSVLPTFLLLSLFRLNEATRLEIGRAVTTCATAVSAVLLLRLIFGPSLFYQTSFASDLHINDGGRALTAQAALILAAAMLISAAQMVAAGEAAARHLLHTLAFGTMLLLSLQATAILAGLAGIVALLTFAPGRTLVLRQVTSASAMAAAIAVITLAPELLNFENLRATLPENLADQFGRRADNFDTRRLIAAGFLHDFEAWSAFDQLFGLPAGQILPLRTDLQGGTYWTSSLHNGYLGVMQSLGWLGLITLLLLLVTSAVFAFFHLATGRRPESVLSLALIAMLLVYAFGYDLRNEVGAYTWLALVAAMPRSAQSTEVYRARAAKTPSTKRPPMASIV